MLEFVNRNLEKTEPDYFYRVSEFVTTFEKDNNETKSFTHFEDFKGNDLRECKNRAEKHYWERLKGLNNGTYFLPFETPEKFEFGKNSAFSIKLLLVEYYNEDENFEFPILGEDDDTIKESAYTEKLIFKKLGLYP